MPIPDIVEEQYKYLKQTFSQYKNYIYRVAKKTWNNLEFDNLDKQKNLEFFRKIMEKPGNFF